MHAHYIPASLANNEKFSDLFYVKEDTFRKTVFIKSRELRPFNLGLVHPDEQITDMGKAGIDMRFISLLPFALNYEDYRCRDWTRESDRALSEDTSLYRNRFRYLATLPMADMEGTIREIDCVIDNPLCAGIEIATNITGIELDDAYLGPFWRKAAEYEIFVLLYPHYTIKSVRLERYHLRSLVGNPLDTTIAAFALMTGDVASEYPGVEICFSHSGGYAPYTIARFEHARRVKKEFEGVQRSYEKCHRNFYYDTILRDAETLQFVESKVTFSYLLMGTDYPFNMSDEEPIHTVSSMKIPREKISDILRGDIERLVEDGI